MNRKTVLRLSVILISVFFIVFGIVRGEPSMVLNKAIAVCLACIGIG